jgi:hypothetical protein
MSAGTIVSMKKGKREREVQLLSKIKTNCELGIEQE